MQDEGFFLSRSVEELRALDNQFQQKTEIPVHAELAKSFQFSWQRE